MSVSELTSLQNTLNAALDIFKAELATQGLQEPSLNTSEPHPTDAVTFLPTPAMFEARRAALASLGLIRTVIQSPYDALFSNACLPYETAGLRLVADIGLATVLGESTHGLSTAEISEKTGVDGAQLERVLRLLITQGWFREPRQGHFANNRMSNIIKNDQPGYYVATYLNELYAKVSLSYPAAISHPDPVFRSGTDPLHTAFQLAYNTDVPFLGPGSWLAKYPEETLKFGLANGGVGPVSEPGVAADFPWAEVCRGKDGIIDVGGGQGTLSCSLAARYPELKSFIVQDLPEAREVAESYILSQGLSHKVIFEAQDFLKPQQRKGKYVYVMQRVLHDWNNENAAKMLRHIHDVLDEDGCLLIIDAVLQHAVISADGPSIKESLSKLDRSVYVPTPPPQLLPFNFGEASRLKHQLDVVMTAFCGSFERTLDQIEEVVTMGGLKIKKVHATRGYVSIVEVVA